MKNMKRTMDTRLNAVACLWDFQLDQLKEFLRITNTGVASEFAKFDEWVRQKTSDFTGQEADEFIDHYYDDLAMVRDVAPQMLRYAQILCLYGSVERVAAEIYRTLYMRSKATKKPDKDMYLDSTKKYLVDFAKFRKEVFGEDWSFLMGVRDVRNAIAHSDGRIGKDERGKAARSFIRTNKHLKLDQLNKVLVEQGFCEELLNRIEAAMRLLFDEARAK